MRIDKFLKTSRIIKRRAVAKEASDSEKVFVNGRVAKPSTVLKVGDIIEVDYFKKRVKVVVRSLSTSTKKTDAEGMYEILEVIQKTE
jgi:ribosomal 50S subunit-recycling heat shock protein